MNAQKSNIFDGFDFLAHFLFILGGWTLVIKFAFPICFALSHGEPLTKYIMWDFWCVIHILLGYSLINLKAHTYWFGIVTSVVEIIIIVSKFVLFASAPEWNIWRTNWFINKIFVLICFCMLFVALVRRGRDETK